MDELMTGSAAILKEESAPATVFAHPLAFNLIPHIDKFQGNGYTKEEMKVAWETNKIFGETPEDLKVSCTAVRVPIIRAHSEAITIETEGIVPSSLSLPWRRHPHRVSILEFLALPFDCSAFIYCCYLYNWTIWN